MRAIARRLDLNFKTVRRYLRAGSVDSLLAGGVQVSVLDSFKPYLNERLAEGERNATLLFVEIAEQGYTGGYKTLARYLRPLRRVDAAAALQPPASVWSMLWVGFEMRWLPSSVAEAFEIAGLGCLLCQHGVPGHGQSPR